MMNCSLKRNFPQAMLGAWLLVLICALGSEPAQAVPARPNILFVLADDLGVNDIASWGDGTVQTPTLDQLSQQSIRFRRHYTDSTCSVSRAALLTGRAPVSIGFEPDGLGLSADLETLPKSLKQLGYRTHHIGKWHVGEALEYPAIWPLRQGFDDWFGMFNHFVLRGPDESGNLVRRAPTFINPWLQENDGPVRQYQGHLDDLLTDRAVRLIRDSERDKPWFINLWLLAPHHPFEPSEEFRSQFPDTDEGRYLALLKQLDHNVGRVLEALKESGQWDNTIVVFASDNGSPNLARNSNYPLVGTKVSYREGGVRTPLLVRWPGHSSDQDILAITHITDLYPTLLSMVAGRVPSGLDGIDLKGLIEGRSPLADRELYWAADVKDRGMSYGGHLPKGGLFYRSLFGQLDSLPVTGPVMAGEAQGPWQRTFSSEQASQLIRIWELKARPVPLQWHRAVAGHGAFVTGRDYQRAPAFGSYSIGLGLIPGKPVAQAQTLLEQERVWKIALDEQGRIRVRHGDKTFLGPKFSLNKGCNSLVASLNIQPGSAHPFNAPASSLFTLYLNGEAILTTTELLRRPVSPEALREPTFLGRSADGGGAFVGQVGKPVVVGKYLLPKQEGYSLQDMDQAVCPGLQEPAT